MKHSEFEDPKNVKELYCIDVSKCRSMMRSWPAINKQSAQGYSKEESAEWRVCLLLSLSSSSTYILKMSSCGSQFLLAYLTLLGKQFLIRLLISPPETIPQRSILA